MPISSCLPNIFFRSHISNEWMWMNSARSIVVFLSRLTNNRGEKRNGVSHELNPIPSMLFILSLSQIFILAITTKTAILKTTVRRTIFSPTNLSILSPFTTVKSPSQHPRQYPPPTSSSSCQATHTSQTKAWHTETAKYMPGKISFHYHICE